MKPPIGDSIGLISPGCGSMGTMMLCERFEEGSAPADALASWKDVDGFYCIRAQIPPRAGNYPMGDTSPGRFYDAGTSAGAVRTTSERGLPLWGESETIRGVFRHVLPTENSIQKEVLLTPELSSGRSARTSSARSKPGLRAWSSKRTRLLS